jgi:excinuclease ABC subunit B
MERAMAETKRRQEKQHAYNVANGITPETIKREIADVTNSMYERDRVTVDAGMAETIATYGHNFQAVINDLEERMKEAAGNLEFEEAARLRDEVKRLRDVEMAVVDDPTAKVPALRSSAATGSQPYGSTGGKAGSRGGKPGSRTFKTNRR